MVLRRDAEGTVKHMEDAKVVVYSQGVDTASTDTKVREARACARSLGTGRLACTRVARRPTAGYARAPAADLAVAVAAPVVVCRARC